MAPSTGFITGPPAIIATLMSQLLIAGSCFSLYLVAKPYCFNRIDLNFNSKDCLMYQVILYAAIATVVCVMFYSILGKSVGKGPDEGIDPEKFMEKPENKNNAPVVALTPEYNSLGLGDIAKKDPDFSPAFFIDGAKQAYSMILEAFAAGDKETLANLLDDETMSVYNEAIDEREKQGYTQVTDLGRLSKTSFKSASLEGQTALISVQYEADLTSALMDSEGNVVQGDPDVLSSITEVWTFKRSMKSSDPTWRLSDVEASEGDELEADPTPDTKPST